MQSAHYLERQRVVGKIDSFLFVQLDLYESEQSKLYCSKNQLYSINLNDLKWKVYAFLMWNPSESRKLCMHLPSLNTCSIEHTYQQCLHDCSGRGREKDRELAY